MDSISLFAIIVFAAAILILAAANLFLLVRLSRRMILDKDALVAHLSSSVEESEKTIASQRESIAAAERDIAVLRMRMAKYPSLFLKRRVYWCADPDAKDKTTAYCPECWNNNHLLSVIEKGVCEKHSPPLQF